MQGGVEGEQVNHLPCRDTSANQETKKKILYFGIFLTYSSSTCVHAVARFSTTKIAKEGIFIKRGGSFSQNMRNVNPDSHSSINQPIYQVI